MALIKCPECEKEISDKAQACIHCGYPLQQIEENLNSAPTIGNKNICPKCGRIHAKLICPDCDTDMVNCHISEDEWFNEIFMNGLDKVDEWEQQMREKYVITSPAFDKELYDARIKAEQEEKAQHQEELKNAKPTPSHLPKCPTCGSTNVEKISMTSKVVGGALFGLFSSNVRNTMHCRNCDYKW